MGIKIVSRMKKTLTGETIKKKYITILDMLKKERLTFGNQLESLEGQIQKQEEEIEKLKVNNEPFFIFMQHMSFITEFLWKFYFFALFCTFFFFSFSFLLHCITATIISNKYFQEAAMKNEIIFFQPRIDPSLRKSFFQMF